VQADLRRAVAALVGDDRRVSLEERLFNSIALINGAANLGGAIWLAGIGARSAIVALHVASALLFLLFYYLSRARGLFRRLYWPFVATIAIFLAANTLGNAGSTGGAFLYFVPALVIAVVLASDARSAILAAALFALLPIGVVWLERAAPELFTGYMTERARVVDVATNFVFVQLFTAALVALLARNLEGERRKSERLLLNVLPASVAEELKRSDEARPRHYASATVLFTDFVGFTSIAERLTPDELVAELDRCFRAFDEIAARHGLEKIKTIGDSYMAAGGVPRENETHAVDCIRAAIEIVRFMDDLREEKRAAGLACWEARVGIHSGPLVAGVIGREKFAYDVWGDTVNTASRMESSGAPGRINVSASTRALAGDAFAWEPRGLVAAKGKGEVEMFFVAQPASDRQIANDSPSNTRA
jgi:adenylate cyclase